MSSPGTSANPMAGDAGATKHGNGTPPAAKTGAYAAPCPQSEPLPKATCPASADADEIACVYGPYLAAACNHTYSCSNADPKFGTPNEWTLSDADDYDCPRETQPFGGPEEAPPLEESECPRTFAAVVQGAACNAVSDVLCGYPQGVCNCTTGAQGGPQHAMQWVCAPVPKGCPTTPPNFGQACGTEGQDCDYGSCTMGDAPTVTCSGGAWSYGGEVKVCP